MVNNWEIEWNSSMIEHGRDMGTMEFIFAKGGTVADMNYVMFDVQDNSWEPLIKAVAERDNSHPDIIRKQAAQQQGIFGMPNEQFRPAVAAAGTAVAPNRKAVQQANQAQYAATQGQNVRDGSTKVGDLYGAGFKGRAAMQAGKNIMGAGKNAAQGAMDMAGRGLSGAKEMGGRALQAVKDSGMGQRMGNFMGKVGRGAKQVGRGISDLRHAPAAAKQSYMQMRARNEDETRRNTLEGGFGRAQRELEDAERRYVPGSQNFDTNMNRAKGEINQQLARDFNINPNTNKKGKATQTVPEAMRDEIKAIGDRRTQPTEGFFDSMKRRGDARRAGNQAQAEGAAYAPSNIATEEEQVPLPAGPSTDAEQTANADEPPKDTMPKVDFEQGLPNQDKPPQEAGQPMKVEPEETATATEPTFGQRFAGEADMKLGRTAGDRVAGGLDKVFGQHQESPFADRDAATQAMLQGGVGTERMVTAGKFSGKTAQAVEAALMEMGFGPAEAKNVAQQAEAGNPEAKQIVEEATGGRKGVEMPKINFSPANEELALSSKKHEASWDSVLKGLNVR